MEEGLGIGFGRVRGRKVHKKLEPQKRAINASSRHLWRVANDRFHGALEKILDKKDLNTFTDKEHQYRKWAHSSANHLTVTVHAMNITPEGHSSGNGTGPKDKLVEFEPGAFRSLVSVEAQLKAEFGYARAAQVFIPVLNIDEGELLEDLSTGETPILDDVKTENEWSQWIQDWDKNATRRYEIKALRFIMRMLSQLESSDSKLLERSALECWEFFHWMSNITFVQRNLVEKLVGLLDNHEHPSVQVAALKACWTLAECRDHKFPMRKLLVELNFLQKVAHIVACAEGDNMMSMAATMQKASSLMSTNRIEMERSLQANTQPRRAESIDLVSLASSLLLEFADEPSLKEFMLGNLPRHISLAKSSDPHCVLNGLDAIWYLCCTQRRKARVAFLKRDGLKVLLQIFESQRNLDCINTALNICSLLSADVKCRSLLNVDECSDCFIAVVKMSGWIFQKLSSHVQGNADHSMHVPLHHLESTNSTLDGQLKDALIDEGHRRLEEAFHLAMTCLWHLSAVIAASGNFDRLDSHESWVKDFLNIFHAEQQDLANVECVYGVLGWISRSPIIFHDIHSLCLPDVVKRLTAAEDDKTTTTIIREACAYFVFQTVNFGHGNEILCDGIWEKIVNEMLECRSGNTHVDELLAASTMLLCDDERLDWKNSFISCLIKLLVLRSKHVLELVITGITRLLAQDESLDTHRQLGDLWVVDALHSIATHCTNMDIHIMEPTYAALWLLSFEHSNRVRMALRGTLPHAAALLNLDDEVLVEFSKTNKSISGAPHRSRLGQRFLFLKTCCAGILWQLAAEPDIVQILIQMRVTNSLVRLLEIPKNHSNSTDNLTVAEHDALELQSQLITTALWCTLAITKDDDNFRTAFPEGTDIEYILCDRCIELLEKYASHGVVVPSLFALQRLSILCHKQRKYIGQYGLVASMNFLEVDQNSLRNTMSVEQQSELQTMCLHLLLNLSTQPENRQAICQNYLSLLIKIRYNENDICRDFCMSILSNCAIGDECKAMMYRFKLTSDSQNHNREGFKGVQMANLERHKSINSGPRKGYSRVLRPTRFGGYEVEGEDIPFDADDSRLKSLNESIRRPVSSLWAKDCHVVGKEERSHGLSIESAQDERSFSLRSHADSHEEFERSSLVGSKTQAGMNPASSKKNNKTGSDSSQSRHQKKRHRAKSGMGSRPHSAPLKSSHRIGPIGHLGSTAETPEDDFRMLTGEDRWKPKIRCNVTMLDDEIEQRYGGPIPRKDTVIFEPGGVHNTVVFRTPSSAPKMQGRVRAFRFKHVKGSLVGNGLYDHIAMGRAENGVEELFHVYHHSTLVSEALDPGDVPSQQNPSNLLRRRATIVSQNNLHPPVPHFEQPRINITKPPRPQLKCHHMTETKAWIGLTHLDIPLGKIPLCKIALFVRQDDDDEESIHSEESVVDWYIGESIFATRKLTKENDSRDIYNSNAMYDKALHVEWKRLLGITRFRKVVGLTDELDAAFEESVFSSLKKYYVDCINLYEYYSCIDGTTQNPFVMGENAFTNIMIDSGISDEGGPCDPATLTRIFGQANVEVGDKNSVENKQNDDKALMRHEWIEAVFRIALGRYEASHPDLNPGEKVGLLFDQYILKEADAEDPKLLNLFCARSNLEIWRKERLYVEPVDMLLSKWKTQLETVYWHYRKYSPFTFKVWKQLLDEANLLKTKLTNYRDAKLVFVQSRMRVIDDLKSHDRNERLSFCDFLEALGRLADSMSIPSPDDMEKFGVINKNSLLDFQAVQGQSKDDKGSHIPLMRRPSSESIIAPKTQPLASKLFMLILHIFSQLGEMFQGKALSATDDKNRPLMCKLAPFMSEKQQIKYNCIQGGQKMESLDRAVLSSLAITSDARRRALAEKRKDEKAEGKDFPDWLVLSLSRR